MKNRKKLLLGAVLLCLLGSTGSMATYAYLADTTVDVKNTFSLGQVTSEIEEVCDAATMRKEPSVKNTGPIPCYVRMRVNISPSMAEEVFELDYQEDWTKGEDGFYYYSKAVEPTEKTTPLFTHVKQKEGTEWVDFDITLYQEAVQTKIVMDGKEITEAKTIWGAYDAGETGEQ